MKNNEPVVLFNAATSSSGDWYKRDYRYSSDQNSVILGELTTGDTINVLGKAVATDSNGVAVTVMATLKSFTTVNFSDAINGPVPYIQITKTGANGAAKVILV